MAAAGGRREAGAATPRVEAEARAALTEDVGAASEEEGGRGGGVRGRDRGDGVIEGGRPGQRQWRREAGSARREGRRNEEWFGDFGVYLR